MENKLKTETNGIIKELNNCKIRTLMATGDNVLTAISVAR
jgi:cation-transporting ATPase 13A3/4/5